MRRFPVQTGLSIAMAALLLAVAQRFVPVIDGVTHGRVEAVPEPPLVRRPQAGFPPAATTVLLDDSNHGLDRFLEALWRTESSTQSAK